MMTIDPERYECPDHKVDLTEQVSDKVEDTAGPPVAYLGLPGSRRAKPRPFQVIVTCPGKDGTGEHSLTCTGTWTR